MSKVSAYRFTAILNTVCSNTYRYSCMLLLCIQSRLFLCQLMDVLDLGSLLFVFLLTAVGNLEKTVFGHGFQTQLAEVQKDDTDFL